MPQQPLVILVFTSTLGMVIAKLGLLNRNTGEQVSKRLRVIVLMLWYQVMPKVFLVPS